jgi:dihydroxy-acid dehydratase
LLLCGIRPGSQVYQSVVCAFPTLPCRFSQSANYVPRQYAAPGAHLDYVKVFRLAKRVPDLCHMLRNVLAKDSMELWRGVVIVGRAGDGLAGRATVRLRWIPAFAGMTVWVSTTVLTLTQRIHVIPNAGGIECNLHEFSKRYPALLCDSRADKVCCRGRSHIESSEFDKSGPLLISNQPPRAIHDANSQFRSVFDSSVLYTILYNRVQHGSLQLELHLREAWGMALRSQRLRDVNRQGDALRMGMDWTVDDLGKPQVLVESVTGCSHPSSVHLGDLVEQAKFGVYTRGGKPAEFYCTDICDGVAQAHAGMRFSLPSRDIISYMTEIHALAHPHDAMVCISTADKAVPGHLMAMARVNLPAIHIPGGTQTNGPCNMSSELMYPLGIMRDKGEITEEELIAKQKHACPTPGSCQFMGTASSNQVIAEALGLALPGSALIPAAMRELTRMARDAGEQVMTLLEENIRPSDILTPEAFHNALVLHAAVGGSTNLLIHLPAIAAEVGIEILPQQFDEIGREVPVLTDVKTYGTHPVEYVWYCGGVPALMKEVREFLHLDCLTVTGKTIGENLEDLEESGWFDEVEGYLENHGLQKGEVLYPIERPYKSGGTIAVLTGNLAPEGAVMKHVAADPRTHQMVGRAVPFDREDDAIAGVKNDEIKPGDVMVIRYEGLRSTGMPEMYFCTTVISARPDLEASTAIITDGRYSGAAKGPAIGHVMPEAALGGPLALVESDDLISIDVPARRLEIVGVRGEHKSPEEIEAILEERRSNWRPPALKHEAGVLSLYTREASASTNGLPAEVAPRAETKSAPRQ